MKDALRDLEVTFARINQGLQHFTGDEARALRSLAVTGAVVAWDLAESLVEPYDELLHEEGQPVEH